VEKRQGKTKKKKKKKKKKEENLNTFQKIKMRKKLPDIWKQRKFKLWYRYYIY